MSTKKTETGSRGTSRRTWTIPIIPKTHNQLNGRHWRSKHAERNRWELAVKALPKGPWLHPANEKRRARIRIVVYRWNLQDPDNAVASCKYLVDALVARGWAVDDNKKWLYSTVEEVIDRKNRRTVIEWEVA